MGSQDAVRPKLPVPEEAGPIGDSEAEYTLEYGVVCPHCDRSLEKIRVVRMLRTRVNFVSTVPRRGRTMICPECRKILSAELTLT